MISQYLINWGMDRKIAQFGRWGMDRKPRPYKVKLHINVSQNPNFTKLSINKNNYQIGKAILNNLSTPI